MFRNKIYTIGLAVILLVSLSGCTDWLDIRPESETILDEYWQSESQAQAVLMACYKHFSSAGYDGRQPASSLESMIVWGELRSDNLTIGPTTLTELYRVVEVDLTASNRYTSWSAMYTTINYCNTFLHFAPQVLENDRNFSEGKLLTMNAEVRTLRALAYFYLVRTFRDIPWIAEPSIDDTQDYQVMQSTEREVIDNIIADLQYAERYARTSFETPEMSKIRITQSAVKALLADVYLWDEQYELAVQKCNEVIADPMLELEDAENLLYNVFYLGGSSESIFEFTYDDDENNNVVEKQFYGTAGNPQGFLTMPLFLTDGEKSPFNYKIAGNKYESEDDVDVRFVDFINQNQIATGYNFIFKYAGLQRLEDNNGNNEYYYTSRSHNWVVYRLSDVMLMKAEALVQLNRSEADMEEALRMVNTTYLRSNPELSGDSLDIENYTTQTEMEELVLRERQRELMFEGKRWFDLMRVARRDGNPDRLLNYVVLKFTGDQALQYSKMSVMDALYFPINQGELDANPNLVQNPFYELTGSSSSTSR